jgi:hypothetical protein
MAEETLILIEVVLFAPEAIRLSDLGVADEAAVFIAVVFLAPQSSRLPQIRVTREASRDWELMLGADLTLRRRARRGFSRRRRPAAYDHSQSRARDDYGEGTY